MKLPRPLLVMLVVLPIALGLLLWALLRDRPAPDRYLGAATCAACHQPEWQAWQTSHHAAAMAKADPRSMLGDFNNAVFTDAGGTTRFHRDAERYVVNTADAGGQPREFAALYTFGVYPLQQVLLPAVDGGLQALNIAWDARTPDEGGQRWFHLQPGETIRPGDPLHWTAPAQNWNFMCADCHSTNLRKNFDAAQQRFDTQWSEINVACEACHGPGAAHADWARWRQWPLLGRLAGADPHLQRRFNERAGPARRAQMLQAKVIADRLPGTEVQACAQCHSRRTQLSNAYVPAEGFDNHYQLALLSEDLYELDGQIRDEVYEHGSFLQSRMFAQGVTCSDCHEPHSGRTRVQGNALCLQCHEARLDTPAHHFHAKDSAGSQCVSCHMPSRNFMVIDARRDHSLRVPRPDLSVRFGTPNACNGCHTDKSAQWAADRVVEQHGSVRKGQASFAAQFAAIRAQSPEAETALRELLTNPGSASIVKATALSEAGPYLHNGIDDLLRQGLQHRDPLQRLGALQALDGAPPAMTWALAAPLLRDPQRSVRIEAARVLGSTDELDAERRRALAPAWAEFVAAVQVNADRAEWRSRYAAALSARGELDAAARELQAALRRDPRFVPAIANLADVYRQQGRDDLGEKTLVEGLKRDPRDPGLHAALGLLRVRQQRLQDAGRELALAVQLAPDPREHRYLYAVSLIDSDPQAAQRFLHGIVEGPRHDRAELYLLVQLLLQRNPVAAAPYRARLAALAIHDAEARALLAQLDAAAPVPH